MSLFLIYFEVGKPVVAAPIPSPICHFPLQLRFKGRTGPVRSALALTDGGSSAAFLAYGNKVLAREGDVLRRKLFQFVRERLMSGARPHLVFLRFEGLVELATVDVDGRKLVAFEDMEHEFMTIKPSEVIEIYDAAVVDEKPRSL